MPCIRIANGVICLPSVFRLPLADGRRVYLETHHYYGPTFYQDRACRREIEDWYADPLIVQACDWFCERGQRA